MSGRCELTDLLIEQCAHCLGHDERDVVDPTTVTVRSTMAARFEGRCALDARHPIEVGDVIGATDEGWTCAGCTERAGATR